MKKVYIIDIDGTIVHQDMFEPRPIKEAVELVRTLYKEHQIILMTRRGDDWSWPHKYSKRATEEFLKEHNIPYHQIVWNVETHRIIVNDQPVQAIQVIPNDGFKYQHISKDNTSNLGR